LKCIRVRDIDILDLSPKATSLCLGKRIQRRLTDSVLTPAQY
jgi:hypothetical protein